MDAFFYTKCLKSKRLSAGQMEQQLKDYRARKLKDRNSDGSLLNRFWSNSAKGNAITPQKGNVDKDELRVPSKSEECLDVKEATELERELESEATVAIQKDWRYYVPYCLYVILWFLLWMFFIEVGFGAVYFAVSGVFLMYRNTRTGPRDKKHLSAYSVFNKNQERLDGTFTAEQFEKELRFGAGTVR